MARLTDLPPAAAKRYAELECPQFKTTPWVKGAPLAERRVAIVSSAGLVVRGEKPFRGRDADYRVIPSETRPEQLMFSHISINLDRSGFQEDWNVAFPLRSAARTRRRGRHRLSGGDPLFLYGRDRSGADGGLRARGRLPAEGRRGRRRPALPRLTALHARRE